MKGYVPNISAAMVSNYKLPSGRIIDIFLGDVIEVFNTHPTSRSVVHYMNDEEVLKALQKIGF